MYLSIFINIFPLAPSGSFFSTYLGVLLFLPLSIINYYKIHTKNDAKKYKIKSTHSFFDTK